MVRVLPSMYIFSKAFIRIVVDFIKNRTPNAFSLQSFVESDDGSVKKP